MLRLLATALAVLTLVTTAQAHFVFVVPEAGGAKAKVVFSDNLEPDGEPFRNRSSGGR